MTQRMALIIAGALTAFLLVLGGGIVLHMAGQPVGQNPVAALDSPSTSDLPATDPSTANSTGSTTFAKLAPAQAAQIALGSVQGARVLHPADLVNLQGTIAYEVPLDQGNVYVDANTGRILASTVSAQNGTSPTTRNGEREGRNSREGTFGAEGDRDD